MSDNYKNIRIELLFCLNINKNKILVPQITIILIFLISKMVFGCQRNTLNFLNGREFATYL